MMELETVCQKSESKVVPNSLAKWLNARHAGIKERTAITGTRNARVGLIVDE